MERTAHPTLDLTFILMNSNTGLIDAYRASVISFCLMYKLEKLSDQQSQAMLSPSPPLEI